ncbi:hypothetical protein ACGC1H_001312 [Rhizoctonia solani]
MTATGCYVHGSELFTFWPNPSCCCTYRYTAQSQLEHLLKTSSSISCELPVSSHLGPCNQETQQLGRILRARCRNNELSAGSICNLMGITFMRILANIIGGADVWERGIHGTGRDNDTRGLGTERERSQINKTSGGDQPARR